MECIVNRDVTTKECHWLNEDIKKDTLVYRFYGHTYGCIGPNGIAVTLSPEGDNPFFELPYDSLSENKKKEKSD